MNQPNLSIVLGLRAILLSCIAFHLRNMAPKTVNNNLTMAMMTKMATTKDLGLSWNGMTSDGMEQ